jgi:hypothetical protein
MVSKYAHEQLLLLLLTFVFTKETEANCNPIYVLSTIIAKRYINITVEILLSFFFSDSFVYRKLKERHSFKEKALKFFLYDRIFSSCSIYDVGLRRYKRYIIVIK